MKILKIDHIGIAAKSIDQVAPFWNAILGLPMAGKAPQEIAISLAAQILQLWQP